MEILDSINEDFLEKVNDKVSGVLARQAQDKLKGIVKMTREGPLLVTMDEVTHYESIGLLLYAMKDHKTSSRELKERLSSSGKKVTVPARIHEMRKRGFVFKPGKGSIYKLSTDGLKWIEEQVLPRLKAE